MHVTSLESFERVFETTAKCGRLHLFSLLWNTWIVKVDRVIAVLDVLMYLENCHSHRLSFFAGNIWLDNCVDMEYSAWTKLGRSYVRTCTTLRIFILYSWGICYGKINGSMKNILTIRFILNMDVSVILYFKAIGFFFPQQHSGQYLKLSLEHRATA